MASNESESTEPFLLVEKCGSNRGRPIYVITKHMPAAGGDPARTREIRCMDLGEEALGSYKAQQGGCTQIQFYNDTNDLKCTNCGMEFSKFYLRQNLFLEVRGLPA
ncbi:hypothetical protein DENSPDRAFT_837142 [Dentipellis sp. KUC8613]|nr:hypothetical protein DENSPDRAFT_837142 [Dentipellis sp. KUC8613]